MGIRFTCHACDKKLNVKSFLAGKRGICPDCNARFVIPTESGGTAQPVVKSSSAPGAGNGLNPAMNLGGAPASIAAQGSMATPTASASVARPATTLVSPATAPTADPLSESPNAVWYVRPSSGGQFGPAAGDVMRQWIAEGRVAADSLVWREGWAEWQSASAKFPQLGNAQASSAAPAAVANPSPAAPSPVATSPAAGAPVMASRPTATPVTAAASAPILGPSSQTTSGATLSAPKKSNGLTALMVAILVIVAIFLMVVFAYILYRQGGQDEYNEARLERRSAEIVLVCDLNVQSPL